MAALRADRTAHAYLFSGPRGCGKTTSARILARCLNCVQAPTDTPCGECESCRELSLGGGGSLDVVEMDAASHGGVDDARELIERAAFAPARDRYKIFIIDEAHMVSNQGFNALLKLVEEPPPHVKFVFATTEPEKVIGTIRSRTHHYPFRLVPPETLENYMAGICDEEGIEIGGGVLPLVVRAGGGSVRDSLSVLDQLIGGSEGGALEYDHAIALLGYTDGSLLDDAVEAIAARDGSTLFAVVERIVQSGHDPRRFVEDLLQRLRDLVVIALAGEDAGDVLVSVPRDQYERMVTQAEHLGASGASRSADLTNEALSGMVGATSPRLQLELLCARLLLPKPAESEDQLARGRFDAGAGTGGRSDVPGRLGFGGHSGADGRSDGAGRAGTRSSAESDNDTTTAVRPAGPPARPASAQRKPPPSRGGAGRPAGRQISPAWAAGSDGSEDGLKCSNRGENSDLVGSYSAEGTVSADFRDGTDSGAGGEADGAASDSSNNALNDTSNSAGAPGAGSASMPSAGGRTASAGGRTANNVVSRGRGPDDEDVDGSDAGGGGQSANADVTIVRQRWAEVAAAVARSSKSTAALIDERNAMIAGIRDGVLGLQFRTAGLATTFNDRDHARCVAAALHDVLGLNLRVRGLVGGDGGPKVAPARSGAGGPRGVDSASAHAERARRTPQRDQFGQPGQGDQRGTSPSNSGGPREVDRAGQSGWEAAESRQNTPEVRESAVRENESTARERELAARERESTVSKRGPATEKPADTRESHPDTMAGPSGAPRGVTGAQSAARESGASSMPGRTHEQNATSAPNARPSNAKESPDPGGTRRMPTSDLADLEKRGLVLASDPVDIPDGPRPTRDQLASALKELESEQAGRSGRPSVPDAAGASGVPDTASSGGVPDVGGDDLPSGAAYVSGTVPENSRNESVTGPAHGSQAFGGLPEPVELDDELDLYDFASGSPDFVPAQADQAGPPDRPGLSDQPGPPREPRRSPGPDPTPSHPGNPSAEESAENVDPAGVLAQLLDKSAGDGDVDRLPSAGPPPLESPTVPGAPSTSKFEATLPSEASSAPESGAAIPPEAALSFGSKPSAESVATGSPKGPTQSESDDIPFYEQRMPMPKRPGSGEPSSADGRGSGSHTVDGNSGGQKRTQGVHTPRGVEGFRGRASSRQTPSISERIMAAHGEGRQKPRAEASAFDDSEDEVSLSDPTISHSDLVGIDVVLSTFDGTVIEEIARTDGGNGGN